MKLRKSYLVILLLIVSVIVQQTGCSKYDSQYNNPDSEWLSGGMQTVFDIGSGAFGHAFPEMDQWKKRVHEIGDGQFNATFVSAPAPLNPGRGPLYNNVSCGSCHISDGRGKVPGIGDTSVSTLFRISIAGNDKYGGPMPVPGFGAQLQNRANFNVTPEAQVVVAYTEHSFSFDDGTSYSLRFPGYTILNPYTALPNNIMLSPRVAAPVYGLGLLEAISDNSILANADADDADGDGISGKPNYVWDFIKGATALGRFGWKANQPSILQQVAAAYNEDIGVTNAVFPVESSFGQPQWDNNTKVELADSLLHTATFYVQTLAVPGRRNLQNPQVQQGKRLFADAGCNKCHIPDMRTSVNVAFPAVSNQLIHPYTDLLLHDMGDDLADNRPDYQANGNEWRTAPLWGIGLTQRVNGHSNFLHDGRARNLLEAVMWHGGEALNAKNKVKAMTAAERSALVKFLESL